MNALSLGLPPPSSCPLQLLVFIYFGGIFLIPYILLYTGGPSSPDHRHGKIGGKAPSDGADASGWGLRIWYLGLRLRAGRGKEGTSTEVQWDLAKKDFQVGATALVLLFLSRP